MQLLPFSQSLALNCRTTKSDKVGESQNFKKFSQELKAMKLRSLHEGTGRPCSPAVGCIRHVHLARNV